MNPNDCKMGISPKQTAQIRMNDCAAGTGKNAAMLHSQQVKNAAAVEAHFQAAHAAVRFDNWAVTQPMGG